jgi:glycosyltransferase involved in cell wall biosynthesis
VVAVVPAHDRADSVGATVAAVRLLPVDEVVVVDDGSGDGTATAAEAAGARVVRLPANRGKGGAVAAGVAATPEAGVYLLVDADIGASAAAAGDLLEPVLAGDADMVIGVLPGAGRGGGFGVVRRLAGAGIARATGWHPRAPLSGQRAVRASLLRRMELAPRFGLETALTIDALRAGARVAEIDVDLRHLPTGRSLSGFLHRGRQGGDIALALWHRLRP